MHELAAQAEAAQAQATALQGLQASLEDSAGASLDALVEAALSRERALQDARNRKVLELLNNKVRKLLLLPGSLCCVLRTRQQADVSLCNICMLLKNTV